MAKKRNMPRMAHIVEHWLDRLVDSKYWLDAYYEVSSLKEIEDIKICFACGFETQVFRCHILAKSLGGTDDVCNLHMLCGHCHIESEHLQGELYDLWFNSKNPKESAGLKLRTVFINKIIEAYPNKSLDEYVEILRKNMK